MALSHMTLVAAEASGWYKSNFSMAEKLYFGKNAGCSFVHDSCLEGKPPTATSPEFCALPHEGGCDFEHMSPSTCFTRVGTVPNPKHWDYFGKDIIAGDPFTDNCPVFSKLGSKICGPGGVSSGKSPEYFGSNSACFKSSILFESKDAPMQGFCYEYKCAKSKKYDNYTLLVLVKSQIFNCKYGGEILQTHVPGLKGKLVCPDPQSFCKIKMETCNQACGGIGTCMEGECVCPSDRVGPDCLRYDTIENDTKCACSYPAVNSYNGYCVCPDLNCSAMSLPSSAACSACLPNCLGCTNVNICTQCEGGFEVSNGKCVSSNSSSQSNSTNNATITNSSNAANSTNTTGSTDSSGSTGSSVENNSSLSNSTDNSPPSGSTQDTTSANSSQSHSETSTSVDEGGSGV